MKDYHDLCQLTWLELIQRIALLNIADRTPYAEIGKPSVVFWRVRASDFKDLNRYEKANENKLMFTQLYNGFKNKFYSLKITHKRPFYSTFKGEGAQDCGGPMREVISNVCEDLMSSSLPLLIPTANNLHKVEPNTDSYKLNT